MRKLWGDEAWEEYLNWQTQDKKMLKKINRLLMDIDRNGYQCIGKPEPLSGNLQGYWSVRIDEKNRIVFRIENNNININSKKYKTGHGGPFTDNEQKKSNQNQRGEVEFLIDAIKKIQDELDNLK